MLIRLLSFGLFLCEASKVAVKPKILFFGLPIGYSHFNFDCSIAEWLIEDGYKVHFLTPILNESSNLTCNAAQVNRHFLIEMSNIQKTYSQLEYGKSNMVTNGARKIQLEFFRAVCQALYDNSELFQIIASEGYSIAIGEWNNNCLSVVFYKLGIGALIIDYVNIFLAK